MRNQNRPVNVRGICLAPILAGSFLEKTLWGRNRDPAKIGAKGRDCAQTMRNRNRQVNVRGISLAPILAGSFLENTLRPAAATRAAAGFRAADPAKMRAKRAGWWQTAGKANAQVNVQRF
jgi:hypothetical protein